MNFSRTTLSIVFTAGICIGLVIGWLSARILPAPATLLPLQTLAMPTILSQPLLSGDLVLHEIDNWQIYTSSQAGNHSLVLRYNNHYIAGFDVSQTPLPNNIAILHPQHQQVLLIAGELDAGARPGKLTIDRLGTDGQTLGFVIDENLDGQPDLRFDNRSADLHVWFENGWREVHRSLERQPGSVTDNRVHIDDQWYSIDMTRFPYPLTPLPDTDDEAPL
ncbi:MAG: hypothetical protein WD572_12365 [Gammaproteobacteria bacterium]